jgi:hypothetical protein
MIQNTSTVDGDDALISLRSHTAGTVRQTFNAIANGPPTGKILAVPQKNKDGTNKTWTVQASRAVTSIKIWAQWAINT